MMRRNPTVLSITAEDIADYEDRRVAEHRNLDAATSARSRADPPRHHRAHAGWTYADDNDSSNPDEDEDQDQDEDDDDEQDRRNREQMDIDGDAPFPPPHHHAAAAGASSSPTGAYATASRQARGRGRAAAAARLQENAARLGRAAAGTGHGGEAHLTAAGTAGQQQAARQGHAGRTAGAGAAASSAPAQAGVVTPETRVARTRDERIGLAPERRRR